VILREIVLRFDGHETVVDADHIVRVDVERDLIADPRIARIGLLRRGSIRA
jgi:hypothetical protein